MAPSSKNCATCAQPAKQHCPRCIEGLDTECRPSPTYYCGKECQIKAWNKHKAICRGVTARKQLFRGGELLQEVFYTYREAAFDLNITDLKRENGVLSMYLASILYVEPTLGVGPVFAFPNHLVRDDAEKKALLAYDACVDATAYMYGLTTKVLEGILLLFTNPTANI